MCLNVTINRSGRRQRQRSRPPRAHERETAGLSREKDRPRAGISPRHANGTRRAASREHTGSRGRTDHPSPPKSRICAPSSMNSLSAVVRTEGLVFPQTSSVGLGRTAGREGEPLRKLRAKEPLADRRWRLRGWRRCRPRRSERARAPASRHARHDPPPVRSGKTCARQPDNREGGAACRH